MFDHLRPGAPVAAAGGKWPAPWMWPLRAWVTHVAADARRGQAHLVTGDHATVVRPITISALDRLLRLHPDRVTALATLAWAARSLDEAFWRSES